jgi:hypothetical protein
LLPLSIDSMVSILSATERNKGCTYSISRQRGIILLLFLLEPGALTRRIGSQRLEGSRSGP